MSDRAAASTSAYDVLRRLLDRESALLVRRLRGFGPAGLAVAAAPFATRADAAHHLAQRLATACQGVEERGSPEPPCWRQVPVLGAAAAADQVAVTATDLAAALATAAAGDPCWAAGGRATVGEVAAAGLAEVVLHRWHVDRAAPGPQVSAALLAALEPEAAPSPQRALDAAAARCAAGGS